FCLAPQRVPPFNGTVPAWFRPAGHPVQRSIETIARPTNKKDKSNGGGTNAKSARHFPQSCSQKQNPAHNLPREWRQIARRRDLVRQFLRAATTGWAFAACLQTRDLDDHAGSSYPIVRT